ncbi:hypothetical protein G8A07_03435 [Roseateles sp. DAIF2]|uniref:hypothetical protein n=1 Tax=Roseateles sp. DAIF2 TaxID=2714952 RepID=UPI0018A291DE|nr:hypothetical protein [Roseateles sp. DAIF2]QPF72074.1 hypothetical protein G8A07_03435 [Roseateles sp. DAIF2]
MTLMSFHPAGLHALWLAMPVLAAASLLVLTPFFGLPAPGLWVTVSLLGLSWGGWLKYRARLGNPLQLAAFLLFGTLSYLSFALGGAGLMVKQLLARPEMLGWTSALLLLSLLSPWLIGLLQAWSRMRREGIHVNAAWLPPMVDVDRWAMRAKAANDAKVPSFVDRYLWPLIGLGLNLPLVLELAGMDRNYAVFLAVPALLYFGWAWAQPLGRMQAYLIGLSLLEKRSGRHLLAAYEGELNELRRGFWGSRWLCPPLPPTPARDSQTTRRAAR